MSNITINGKKYPILDGSTPQQMDRTGLSGVHVPLGSDRGCSCAECQARRSGGILEAGACSCGEYQARRSGVIVAVPNARFGDQAACSRQHAGAGDKSGRRERSEYYGNDEM